VHRAGEAALTVELEEIGRLNHAQLAEVVEQFLLDLDPLPDRLVLDLARVEYVDSAGIRSLIGLLARIEAAGMQLQLRNPRPMVRRAIEVLNLEHTFLLEDPDEVVD
jgi:anti-anti-sigma factor